MKKNMFYVFYLQINVFNIYRINCHFVRLLHSENVTKLAFHLI